MRQRFMRKFQTYLLYTLLVWAVLLQFEKALGGGVLLYQTFAWIALVVIVIYTFYLANHELEQVSADGLSVYFADVYIFMDLFGIVATLICATMMTWGALRDDYFECALHVNLHCSSAALRTPARIAP